MNAHYTMACKETRFSFIGWTAEEDRIGFTIYIYYPYLTHIANIVGKGVNDNSTLRTSTITPATCDIFHGRYYIYRQLEHIPTVHISIYEHSGLVWHSIRINPD